MGAGNEQSIAEILPFKDSPQSLAPTRATTIDLLEMRMLPSDAAQKTALGHAVRFLFPRKSKIGIGKS